MKLRSVRWLATAILVTAGSTVSAATSTGTLGLSGTVVSGCTVSTTALSFGNAIPSPVATNRDAQSTLLVTCTNGTTFFVAMNAGSGSGATVAQRRMTSGGGTLAYGLYMNAARTVAWGDGTLGTFSGTATGTGAQVAYGIWGRIPPGQTPPPGTFTDLVTVTLTF